MPKIINKSQVKIILEIFRNPGINLREIISRTKLSPNYVSDFVNRLVERKILNEEKLEKKRVYLRRFFLNLKSESALNFFKLVKEEEKDIFLEKYPKLKPIFIQLEKESGVGLIMVYGSYARLEASKESDIDILIVGNIKNKEKIKEVFVTLDVDVSIKVENLKDFKTRKDDALHRQIIKEGIILFDKSVFSEILIK